MSSTYSQSSRGSTVVEKRIYSLSTHNSTETISTASIKPSRKRAIPRVTILIAPHMAPYVVPWHKVKTWESFQRTLVVLFGVDVFNERMVRVTDRDGMPILPLNWKEFLEPDVTIIVDTCAYIPPSSPVINKELPFPPAAGYGHHRSLSTRRGQSRGSTKRRSWRDLDSVTLAERESEDSTYEAACVLSPLGQPGQCALSPPNSLKSRPQRGAWDGWSASEKRRDTCVSMFMSGRVASGKVQPPIPARTSVINKSPIQPHDSPNIQVVGWSESGSKRTGTAGSNYGPVQHKKGKSVWSKITKALMYVFSGGSSSNRNTHDFKGRVKQFQREDRFPMDKPREHILSQAPDSLLSSSPSRRRPTSARPESKDSPLSLPPRLVNPSSLPFEFSTSLQRSKSLSYFPELDVSRSAPLRSSSHRIGRSSNSPDPRKSPSPKLKPQTTRPASSELLRRRNISPPVPQRPSGNFGFNPQYEVPTTIHMAQILEIANDQYDGERCRTGSTDTDTDQTLVDVAQKPLPLIPNKLRVLPSAVPQPLSPALPEADRRPPTTTPLIVRTSSYGKRFTAQAM
ncbi:hypothetical protein K440DRAFT_638188 [Wilcoxina mikolae CBS 423.85]|nr:hypothetical protein K440DRAFT_638188 [Wilcoxina mikolae CBS 423.85]